MEQVDQARLLGLILDSRLRFRPYCEELITSLSTRLKGLKIIFKHADLVTRKQLGSGIFKSKMLFNLSAIAHMDTDQFERISVLYNELARQVLKYKKSYSLRRMFADLGWLDLEHTVTFQDQRILFSILYYEKPKDIFLKIQADSMIRHGHDTRYSRQKNLRMGNQTVKRNILKDWWLPRAIRTYNSLPGYLKRSNLTLTNSSHKSLLKKYLQEEQNAGR